MYVLPPGLPMATYLHERFAVLMFVQHTVWRRRRPLLRMFQLVWLPRTVKPSQDQSACRSTMFSWR